MLAKCRRGSCRRASYRILVNWMLAGESIGIRFWLNPCSVCRSRIFLDAPDRTFARLLRIIEAFTELEARKRKTTPAES